MIRKLFLFVSIFILINAVASIYFYKVSIAKHKLIYQDRIFTQFGPRVDLLIMGHSRPAKAIDLTQVPYGVQFCSGGESNIHTFYKLRHILEDGDKKVKRVVLPAGFGSFNLPSEGVNSNAFYWKKYVDFLVLGEELDAFWPYLERKVKAIFFPWFEYPYLKAAVVLGDFNLRIDKRKFLSGSDVERAAIAKQMYQQTMQSRSYYHALSLSYLSRTIALCQQHNVELVYIKYPVTMAARAAANTLIREYDLVHDVQAVDSIIKANPDVHFLDLSSFFEDNDRLYFNDPQHLNKKGSVLFTGKLMASISTY